MALVQNVDQVVPCELFAAEKCAWAQLVSANETCKVFVVSVNQDPSDVQLVSETISAAWAVCLPKTMVSLLEPAEADVLGAGFLQHEDDGCCWSVVVRLWVRPTHQQDQPVSSAMAFT